MKSKSARLVRRNHARYHQGRDDLNIVPMIDMMVILVFFLIFTAVFSKTNILQLNLPANNPAPLDLPKGLKLEVIIRPDDLRGQRPQFGTAQGPRRIRPAVMTWITCRSSCARSNRNFRR